MLKRLALVALLSSALLAGCATTDDDQPAAPGFGGYEGTGLHAGPALWQDPQNFPHPKFNWPTLSSPSNATDAPAWWQPINMTELPAHISGLQFVARAGADQDVTAGAGIALFGRLAVVPSDGWNGAEGGWVVDISDPTHPQRLGTMETTGRGAAIIAYPDGRLVTVVSTTAGFDTVDITDPTAPVVISNATPSEGGHKLGVVPGTPYVYNAGSSGGDPINPLYGPGPCNVDISQCVGYTSIYDMTDPVHPVLVQEFQNGLACHHIFFWNALDGSKQRAICAGIQYTQIWDTADPANPRVLVNVPVHHGVANTPSGMLSIAAFSHTAGINLDGTILYVGDENMGGGTPPGCGAGTSTPVGEVGTPVGATWFYDISDETNPQLLGYFSPPRDNDHGVQRQGATGGLGSCTTHHGRIVPDKEGRDLLAMSYYNDGTILIDFTPVAEGVPAIEPKAIGEYADGSDTWETWYYGGYLFLGDLNHGLDVVGFT